MRKIQLAVRDFALPVPRQGSIETHSGYGPTPQLGSEIHLRTQSERRRKDENYIAEKWISASFKRKTYQFVVSGRMDGFTEGSSPLIEEIKSAFDIESLHKKLLLNPDHPYHLQLQSYGYFHFLQTGVVPRLRLHLVSSRNFKSENIDVELDPERFERWLDLRLDELVEETKRKEKVFDKRVKIAETMSFPFPSPRPGQKELIAAVEENFFAKTPILIQAPTGLGKTAGILYPALKEAFSRGQKVIYVTPKNSQHQVAEEAVRKLQESGAKIRVLTLTSKGKTCLQAEPLCNPEYCEFAKDYYSKVQTQELGKRIAKLKNITAKKLNAIALECQVCPFELSLEAVDAADVVICDYNYVFAPYSLISLLAKPLLTNEKPNLVIDEAHNLPSRAQDYFSPSLSTLQLLEFEPRLSQLPDPFRARSLSWLKEAVRLIESYREGGPRKIEIDKYAFDDLAEEFSRLMSDYLEADIEIQTQDPILKISNLWLAFVESLEWTSEAFFRTYQALNGKMGSGDQIKTTCCDAAEALQKSYKEFANVCAFSATLKPFEYYGELLGFSLEKSKFLEFHSPFPPEHRKLIAIPQISTKLKDRIASAAKIADVIDRIMPLKAGNYLAVFPSFDFLYLVKSHLKGMNYDILQQTREMKPAQVNFIFDRLKESAKPQLLLGVQGGILAEGIDYPGDLLIGSFIVGPALPTFDFEREQIRQYYEKRYGTEKAFDYTYTFPAMAKAVQSAGRVIRSESDKGLIVLIDPRFLQDNYAAAMPETWFEKTPRELSSRRILEDVKDFWLKAEIKIPL